MKQSAGSRLVLLVLGCALIGLTVWLVPARAGVTDVSGGLLVEVEHPGSVMLEAANMVPGEITQGSMRVTNSGLRPIRLALRTTSMTDTPGPYGGTLSGVARLKLTNADYTKTYYDGAIASLPQEVAIGRVSATDRVTVIATALFPSAGRPASATTGDNAFMESSLRAVFRVVKTELPDDAALPPAAVLREASRSGAAISVASSSTSRSCVSRRSIPIRLVMPRTFTPRRVVVTAAGKRIATRWKGRGKARRLTATIKLSRYPRARVPVRVVVTRKDGRSWRYTRYFRTCAAKQPSAAKRPKFTPNAKATRG